MIRIHHFPRTRSLRIIWQCEEMGLPYETVAENFPVTDQYRALNPIGAMPYLEDGDVAMNESIAMMLYLAERYGPTPIWPAGGDAAFPRAVQFLIFGEAHLGGWGNAVMVTRFLAPQDQKENFTAKVAMDRLVQGLGFVAATLGESPFIAGDRFTLADISVGYCLGVARTIMGIESSIDPALLSYHDRLTARPAYQQAAAV
jgi:glutathione S-transferase